MAGNISIRAYNVGFGDCLLLRLPDGNATRHVLIDFGRAPNDPGSVARFDAIAADIHRRTGGHLDLLVVTHEHLDHMEGFYRQRATFDAMQVDRVWMSLPSSPDYYSDYPDARLQKRIRDGVAAFGKTLGRNGVGVHPAFLSLLQNNLANKDRVDYLRQLAPHPRYLARGAKGRAAHTAFKHIRIRVLAPEADTSKYYGRTAKSHALLGALARTMTAGQDAEATNDWTFPHVRRAAANEMPGVSASDFARLRRTIREDGVAAARFIDRAQNNTSLCLLIEAFGSANAIQALAFAALHGDPPRFLFYLAMGLLGGWLVRRTRSLAPAIALHGLNNALAMGALMATLR